jgi:hypothetical protein
MYDNHVSEGKSALTAQFFDPLSGVSEKRLVFLVTFCVSSSPGCLFALLLCIGPSPLPKHGLRSITGQETLAGLEASLYSDEVSSTGGRWSASGSSFKFWCSLKSNFVAVVAEVAMLDHCVVPGCDSGYSVFWFFFSKAVHCPGAAQKKQSRANAGAVQNVER